MFDKDCKKYITRGVDSEIPVISQIVMWDLIDDLSVEVDYLQVFDLSKEFINDKWVQKIRHHQEVPEFSQEIFISSSLSNEDIVDDVTVFVIDDGSGYATMLLADEY